MLFANYSVLNLNIYLPPADMELSVISTACESRTRSLGPCYEMSFSCELIALIIGYCTSGPWLEYHGFVDFVDVHDIDS